MISNDSTVYDQAIEGIGKLELLLTPARPRQIGTMLARLRLHFPLVQMSERETTILLTDYLTDLALYPADIIERACLEYRRDGKNLFFPKIGQLLLLMRQPMYERQYKLRKLKKLLESNSNIDG